jgi:hypothetical protein
MEPASGSCTQLGGLSHTQLKTVSSFCMECRAGAVGGYSPGQCMMIQLLLRVQRPLLHYNDCASPDVQNITAIVS